MKNKIFIIALITLLFTGCKAKKMDTTGKIKICTTIFPEYDWAQNIIGQNNQDVILSLLIKNGVDLHSFQPTTQDILEIANSDLFIYVGGESDEWIKEALNTMTNKKLKVINLMECLDKVYEEQEGLEPEEESEDEEEIEYDEHVWLSIKNAKKFCQVIFQNLVEIDPKNMELYKTNLENYMNKLNSLDTQFQKTIKSAKYDTLIFCDRFPFLYLINDYNLNYYAAFKGCSSETQASFKTISTLAQKLQETNLNSIIVLEHSDKKLANTVITTAKKPLCNIIELDSMQTTTLNDIFNGKTYINTMEKTLDSIRKALN